MAITPYAGTSGVEISGDFNDKAVFPDDLGVGTTGGPRFNTTTHETYDGERFANIWWGLPLHRYTVLRGVRDSDKIARALAFYRQRGGATEGYRFRDPFDCSTHPDFKSDPDYFDPTHRHAIAAGDGVTTEFRMCKRYRHAGYEAVRPITHTDLVQPYVNGVIQTINAHYVVNHEAGVITFGTAPPAGHVIEWAGTHHVPCRFSSDIDLAWLHRYSQPRASSPGTMELVEIRAPIQWGDPQHASGHVAWSINNTHMMTLSQGRLQTITPLADGLSVILPRASEHPLGDGLVTLFNGSPQYGLRVLDADENVLIGGLAPKGWAEFLLRRTA